MLAVLHNSFNSPYFPVLIILIFVCVFIGLQMYTPGLNSIKSQKVGDFLTSLTLLSSYMKSCVTNGAVSCKKKDVLNLTLVEYKKYADSLTEGFMEAEKLLQEERIFVDDDVPYSTQLIPLSAICAVLIQNNKMFITSTKEKIKQWYWCGVFGELYGGAK